MPEVSSDSVFEEVGQSSDIRFMSALVRSSLFHGADNKPALLILTKDALFYGGSNAMRGRFQRVPLRSVVESSKAGSLLWECVKLTHMELEGEKTVYLCPFTGSPAMPKKDSESMDELINHLKPGV
jgi:hypothetical protein